MEWRALASKQGKVLTPQLTIQQDTPEVAVDGAGLSCPDSRVVAEEEREENGFKSEAPSE